jgi:hypothetical protein
LEAHRFRSQQQIPTQTKPNQTKPNAPPKAAADTTAPNPGDDAKDAKPPAAAVEAPKADPNPDPNGVAEEAEPPKVAGAPKGEVCTGVFEGVGAAENAENPVPAAGADAAAPDEGTVAGARLKGAAAEAAAAVVAPNTGVEPKAGVAVVPPKGAAAENTAAEEAAAVVVAVVSPRPNALPPLAALGVAAEEAAAAVGAKAVFGLAVAGADVAVAGAAKVAAAAGEEGCLSADGSMPEEWEAGLLGREGEEEATGTDEDTELKAPVEAAEDEELASAVVVAEKLNDVVAGAIVVTAALEDGKLSAPAVEAAEDEEELAVVAKELEEETTIGVVAGVVVVADSESLNAPPEEAEEEEELPKDGAADVIENAGKEEVAAALLLVPLVEVLNVTDPNVPALVDGESNWRDLAIGAARASAPLALALVLWTLSPPLASLPKFELEPNRLLGLPVFAPSPANVKFVPRPAVKFSLIPNKGSPLSLPLPSLSCVGGGRPSAAASASSSNFVLMISSWRAVSAIWSSLLC